MKNALMFPAVVSALTDDPYSRMGMKIPRCKPQRGVQIGCCVCGAAGVTLYKDGNNRICGKCKKEKCRD